MIKYLISKSSSFQTFYLKNNGWDYVGSCSKSSNPCYYDQNLILFDSKSYTEEYISLFPENVKYDLCFGVKIKMQLSSKYVQIINSYMNVAP